MTPNLPPPPKDALKRVLEYFTTLQGWLSVVPTFVTLLDAGKGWLPIAPILKPWVYILIVFLTSFAVWMEVSKAAGALLDDDQKRRMRRRAVAHMCTAVALIGGYWIFGEVLTQSVPADAALRTLALFTLAVILAGVFAEVSRTFALLALATDA